MKGSIIYFLLGISITGLFLAFDKSPNADIQDARQYCRMVWVHKHDINRGWPDFNHVYAKQCNSDGTLNKTYLTEL